MTHVFSLRTYAGVARVAMVGGLALTLGACSQTSALLMGESNLPEVQAVAGSEVPRSEAEKVAENWGKEYTKTPRSGKVAINYARSLKALDRKAEAFAVLQAAYLFNAQDREYLSEFGRLALDQGHAPMAQQLLERADDPSKPDWRVLSARGVALAQQGQYKAAIPFLERARTLAPSQASVANNLALVYTMDGQAAQAEPMLRQASTSGADPRVRQNLALVLRLQGKADEATRVAMVGNDQPLAPPTLPVAVAARPAPASAALAPVRTVARGSLPPLQTAAIKRPAPVSRAAAPAVSAEPEDVIRAAIEAEISLELQRARDMATSSVPQR
jgi:Flp pilus assembly protein TadD